jgi:hypothetical protein
VTAAKEILTNSGVTAAAESSGGQGGVVFSGYTDFDTEITVADAQALFATAGDEALDYAYWDKYKSTSATPTDPQTGNAISFPGYPELVDGRDGLSADTAWIFGEEGAHVDVDFSLGTAYCEWERMNPAFRILSIMSMWYGAATSRTTTSSRSPKRPISRKRIRRKRFHDHSHTPTRCA